MNWFNQHYYDLDGNPVEYHVWAELLEDIEARRVAQTEIVPGIGVSTVWLGLNMNYTGVGPPLIYETMIFGGAYDCYQWREPNRHAALACHDQAVAMARESVSALLRRSRSSPDLPGGTEDPTG